MFTVFNYPKYPKPAPPKATVVTEVRHRLSQEAYEALEKALPKPGAPRDAHEAGVIIGVQMTLKLLRDGFTVSSQ